MIAHARLATPAPEHEFEAEPGLPEALPPGERLLWRGSPSARVMAREAMHTRLLTAYFTVLLAVRAVTVLANGGSAADAALAVVWLLPAALLALGGLTLMGWLIARTAVYTITDKRVVMRIGVVLSITFNLPFSKISSAALRASRDGSGDISLVLCDTDNIAYVHLWPHARPWRLTRTEPMLRALGQAPQVSAILAAALADTDAYAGTQTMPKPQRVASVLQPVPSREARRETQPIAA